MTQQVPAQSAEEDKRELDGLELGDQNERSHRLSWVPLFLVMLSLAGLAITPLVFQHHTRELRTSIRLGAEPSHLLLGELRVGLARELSLAQRFALTRQSGDWFAYHVAAASDDSLLAKLEQTLRKMGRPARASVANLRQSVDHWRLISAVVERSDSAHLLRDALRHGVDYEDLLLASVRVDSTLSHEMQWRRDEVDNAASLQFAITIAFVAVGIIACIAVLILTLRDRHLRILLRRRAEEEASLRRLAATLNGALTVDEVGELTVAAALDSSRVGGAYLTRAEGNELVTVAGRGTLSPGPRSRLPIPPWLTESSDKEHPRLFTTEVKSARPSGSRRGTAPDPVSLLIVPLSHGGEVIGALGLVSAGGRRQFGDSALRFGRALGDLAGVALHRAEALDREQKARTEAESAVRTRDAVVSIVSHDLRNPLMAILGSAELLLEMIRDDAQMPLRPQLEALKHAAASMDRLVCDLLDVTRLESGPLPVTCRPLNILDVVNDVIGIFQAVVQARHVALTCSAPAVVPPLAGDRDRLGQALSNLLGNAVKFTPDGGSIHVAVDVQPAVVRVSVRDTGAGIPADQVPRLFDRFWQASREDHRGLGLGLTIVKAVVEAHGGSITVDSTPNKGSIFAIVLPRLDVTAGQRPSTTTTPPSMENRTRPTRERAPEPPHMLVGLPPDIGMQL